MSHTLTSRPLVLVRPVPTGSVLDRYAALRPSPRTDPTRTPDAKRDAIDRQQERRAKQEMRRG